MTKAWINAVGELGDKDEMIRWLKKLDAENDALKEENKILKENYDKWAEKIT